MYTDDIVQLNIILMSVGLGGVIALFYDVYSVINLQRLKSKNSIVLKDIIFCLLIAFICFLFLLIVNNGRIRIYHLPGAIAGYCCWHFSFSDIFVKLFNKLIIRICDILSMLGKVLSLPFRPFNSLMDIIFDKLCNHSKKYFEKLKNKFKIYLKKI